MWSAIENGARRDIATDASSVGEAAAYLRFEQSQQAQSGFRGEFRMGVTSNVPAFRGFGDSRSETAVSADLQWQGDSWTIGIKPAYAADPDDDENLRLDGSYAAWTTGNWVLGAGAIDRWWGPGWQSSLILSDNARPMPSVWLNRRNTSESETPWLSWIGPWQLTLIAGEYEHARAVPNAKLLGMRLALRPIDGLDVGFSRAIMFGGEGRPEGASTIWNALIGRDNGQLEESDPGNQLGSIDIRYGFAVGEQSMGLYAQMMGEDEAGAFPARKSWLFGADWTTQWLNGDQQWFLEYTNTLADDLTGGAIPNITYDHGRYRTGYRYYGRNMATSFDGDAEAITFGGYHFFTEGSRFNAKVTYARLNEDGVSRTVVGDQDVFYTVPSRDQNLAILDLGYGTEVLQGWLNLSLQATDKSIDYLSGKKEQWALGADWTYRF
ncbi:hypothetical protein MSNKSG1_08803 [Marinobacter santoriniensis NKSG1]|jgi:hypothetical protein|uniref:Capsule assembly protein Wzi n=2 Tax=Marinobacter santoriniensis TaxID=523742 RepID=M7D5H4_9GAMM|nr:hypothetical protein MSNKSG1_08803 [Marinobacter santoriniensis NKSG1]